MASRTRQKEEARQRRLAEERARAEKDRRERRIRMIGGAVVVAIAIAVVGVVISTSGSSTPAAPPPTSAAAKVIATKVNASLTGIPQSGMTLGSPSAPVTVTEYGDLECPVCKDFALAASKQLIANEVKAGKVKLVYQPLETATGNGPNASWWVPQQTAAVAAGKQNLAWNYILMFYNLQGNESASYVNDNYLNDLAKLVPGLNYSTWLSDRSSSSLNSQISTQSQTDAQTVAAQANGNVATPTIVAQGPKGSTQAVQGNVSYSGIQQMISSVS